MCKFFINFSKFFKRVDLCWMFSLYRNLETPLQYRTWKEFMYEIFLMSPPQKTILAPPLYTVYVLYSIFMLSLVPPPKFLYVADPMQSIIQVLGKPIIGYVPLLMSSYSVITQVHVYSSITKSIVYSQSGYKLTN